MCFLVVRRMKRKRALWFSRTWISRRAAPWAPRRFPADFTAQSSCTPPTHPRVPRRTCETSSAKALASSLGPQWSWIEFVEFVPFTHQFTTQFISINSYKFISIYHTPIIQFDGACGILPWLFGSKFTLIWIPKMSFTAASFRSLWNCRGSSRHHNWSLPGISLRTSKQERSETSRLQAKRYVKNCKDIFFWKCTFKHSKLQLFSI